MAFNNYLEDENDKPYFTTNSLAYYYDKMEGFAKAVEGSAKALNLTKEEVEKRLTAYIEQNKNELDQRLSDWDGKLETFDSSVETLLTEWVDDGTLTPLIDSTLIDKKIAPLAGQLADKVDEVVQDGNIVTFKSNGIVLYTFDLSVSANASLVEKYVDTLVSNGSIAGVTLANDSVTEEHIKGLETTVKQINETVKTFNQNISPTAFSIVDEYGKSALEIDENGLTTLKPKNESGKLATYDNAGSENLVVDVNNSDYEFSLVDKNGKVLFGVDNNGKFMVSSIESQDIVTEAINGEKIENITKSQTVKHAELDAEINMFIAYGQSWSLGYDVQAISLNQKYDSLMFNTGIKTADLRDTDASYTSFIPLVEKTTTSLGTEGGQILGETPAYAQTAMIKQLLQEENNIGLNDVSYQLLSSAPGMGSTTIEQLSKGTDYYNRLIAQVQAAYTIAKSQNKSFKVQAFSWAQSGSSDPAAEYMELLEQLRIDIDTDVKAITNQTKDVKCITWQNFPNGDNQSGRFYDRYVKASETYENIICSGAAYHFDHVKPGSNLHLTSESSAWLGAYFGLAYKRSLLDGEKFEPLKPVDFTYDDNVLYVKFHVPQLPLKFDTEQVGENDNLGFNIYTTAGVEKDIVSVSIVSLDTVKIISNQPLVSTDRLLYGDKGVAWGRLTGKRGNLRDSQGDTIIYDKEGLALPLHNWCVVFDKTIGGIA